jgi:hypothetical protein
MFFKGKSLEERFWQWFTKNEPLLLSFDATQVPERERIFDSLSKELARIDADLTFEFGPPVSPREFVISAGGIKRAFPAVSALVAAAPRLERWKVIAFRPRRPGTLSDIELGGVKINADDVQLSLVTNGTTPGILLFLPGYDDAVLAYKQIGYLLLDMALGEFDVETKVGLIEMLRPEERTEGERYTLAELPERFDRLAASLGLGDPQA